MLKEFKNLLSFLTIFPVGMYEDYLSDSANYMHFFPVIGAFIGFLSGIFTYLLLNILPSTIVGILSLCFIQFITGLHHTDGLLDFGDGLMCQGPPERKIEAMHDIQIGAGGVTLLLVTFLLTAQLITDLERNIIMRSLILSEVSAKFSMVLMARIGRSACDGMNTYFINSMHDKYRDIRLSSAFLFSSAIAIYLMGKQGPIVIISSILLALTLVTISQRHFKGLTGDVFGAGNELSRLFSLITVMVVKIWV